MTVSTIRVQAPPLEQGIFEKALREHIDARTREIIDDEMKGVADRVRKRINDEVDVIALHIAKQYTFDSRGETLTIQVKKL